MDRNICNDGTVTYTESNNYCRYAWYLSSNDNSFGSITAMQELHEGTKDWNNVPTMELSGTNKYIDEANFFDVTDKGYTSLEIIGGVVTITGKPTTKVTTMGTRSIPVRARLPKYGEVNIAGCTNGAGSCPVWLMGYMTYYGVSNDKYSMNNNSEAYQNKISGYWLLYSVFGFSGYASSVNSYGEIGGADTTNGFIGVRPVITVPREYLES